MQTIACANIAPKTDQKLLRFGLPQSRVFWLIHLGKWLVRALGTSVRRFNHGIISLSIILIRFLVFTIVIDCGASNPLGFMAHSDFFVLNNAIKGFKT